MAINAPVSSTAKSAPTPPQAARVAQVPDVAGAVVNPRLSSGVQSLFHESGKQQTRSPALAKEAASVAASPDLASNLESLPPKERWAVYQQTGKGALRVLADLGKPVPRFTSKALVAAVGIPADAVRRGVESGEDPLGEQVSKTFRNAAYFEYDNPAPLVLYRRAGGQVARLGFYWSRISPKDQPGITLADWAKEGGEFVSITVPAGVRIFEGEAEPIPGYSAGLGDQIYLTTVDAAWETPASP